MKLGEIEWVLQQVQSFIKFWWKTKKVLCITLLTDSPLGAGELGLANLLFAHNMTTDTLKFFLEIYVLSSD